MLTGPLGVPLGVRTRKQLGLLFYLARRARPVGRDELIDLFWSQDSEKLARHSLSQSCSLINKLLGAEVVVTAGRDRMAVAEGTVWLDVNEFERLVSGGSHQDAMGLWRGALFEGLWVQRAPQFERWLNDERDKLQRMFRRLAHGRVEALRNGGEHQAMREEAERLLQHDPLDEKAMHAYLEAQVLLGDRSLALRRYGEFEARLRKELDAEPGPALRSWAKRHRKGDGPAPSRERLAAPRISEITVLPAAQPFFGRTEEFAMLWKAWETAGSGTGAFIIVEGEAGIGKTALATKLVNQAHVAGGSVCFVKCYRTEKSVPFAPITALIRQLSRLPGFVALDPVWIGELTRLVPELRERYPNVPQPMAVDDAARHRLSDATMNSALCVADEQPLLVVIDDLQDADESSLALLHYLGRQTPSQPVVLVGIVRTEQPLTEFERTFFVTARDAGFARTLRLGALPTTDIERLIEQVLAHGGVVATPWLVKRIAVTCRGNPLAAVEATLASGGSPGSLQADLNGPDPIALHDDLQAPESFLETAAARLGSLTSVAQLVAQAVAIAGRPLSEHELGAVTRLGPAELAAGIITLETAHFARRFGASVGFAHERYSSAVERVVEAARRNELHLQLATLTTRFAEMNPAMHYEAARHFLGAGNIGDARKQASAAADYAASVGAMRSKTEALELLRSLEGGLDQSQVHDLCACYLHLNDLESLRRLCASMRGGASSVGRQLGYYEIAADYQSGSSGFAETEARLELFLHNIEEPFTRTREAHILLIRIADKTGNYKRVRSLARTLRRSGLGSHALFAAAYVQLKYYWASNALPLMQEALEAARSEGEIEIEQLSRDGVAILLKQVGRYRDSIRQFDFSLGLARKTMNPHAEVACLHNRAVSELCLGEFERVRASHTEAERVGAGFARWGFHLYRAYNTSLVDYYEGDLERALHGLNTVFDECLRHGMSTLARQAKACAALVLMRLGSLDEFRLAVDGVRTVGGDREQTLSWTDAAAFAYYQALIEDKPDKALSGIARRVRELARRDVSLQLALELERVRLIEVVTGQRAVKERQDLHRAAEQVEAGAILQAVRTT